MSDRHSIDVEVTYSTAPPDSRRCEEFLDVQYLSFINGGTFGVPALIADAKLDRLVEESDEGVTVLYVNTGLVETVKATRNE